MLGPAVGRTTAPIIAEVQRKLTVALLEYEAGDARKMEEYEPSVVHNLGVKGHKSG